MGMNTDLKILLVDDMSVMRKIIKKSLSQMEFCNITEADDGTPAWKLLEDAKGEKPFELIISDWNMPQMTGIELLRKVRGDDTYKQTPFLMITSEGEQKNVEEALSAGVSNFIIKPFTHEAIEEKIKKIVGA